MASPLTDFGITPGRVTRPRGERWTAERRQASRMRAAVFRVADQSDLLLERSHLAEHDDANMQRGAEFGAFPNSRL